PGRRPRGRAGPAPAPPAAEPVPGVRPRLRVADQGSTTDARARLRAGTAAAAGLSGLRAPCPRGRTGRSGSARAGGGRVRLVTFQHGPRCAVGAVDGEQVVDLQAAYAAYLAEVEGDPHAAAIAAARIPATMAARHAGSRPEL